MLVSEENGESNGFLCLKETGKDTVELAVMGVLPEYHRKGIGTKLFEAAKKIAVEKGFSFLQVKTVQMGKYEEYDRTNRFYLALGFKEFEVIPTLWDERNPCQIYVMSLR
jgi:GNAT superfamily N-acetyltransferase